MLNIDSLTCHFEREEILYISWLDYDPYMKHNFEAGFVSLIDRIRREHIKKIVLDSNNRVHDPSNKDFKEMFLLIFSGLCETDLEKFARVRPLNSNNEATYRVILDEVFSEVKGNFEFQIFDNKEDAFNWLSEDAFIENCRPA